MQKVYRTIKKTAQAEIIIDKSTFIGYAAPVNTEEEAQAFISEIKKKHRDATHNVPAYVIGEQNEIQRFSDDGEPSGTAGIPILEVLKKEDVRNTVVVVTRYFGGIKLGAGGLVRAYTKGAKIALDAAEIITKVLHQVVIITIDYSLLGMMQNQLKNHGIAIKETLYDEMVHLHVWVTIDDTQKLLELVTDWTSGRGECVLAEREYRW